MTEPGGGGDRLEVGVVADATGFAKDAQAKIDAAVARVKANIKADIDYRRLQAQAEASAKRISKTTQIKLQIGVDKKHLLASMDAAVAAANAQNYAVKVKVEVDRKELDEALAKGGTVTIRRQTIDAGGGGGAPARAAEEAPAARAGILSRLLGRGKATVPVTADTTEAEAEIEGLRQRASSEPIDVPVEIQQDSIRKGGRGIRIFTQNMTGLQKFGFYSGLVTNFAAAVTGAVGGLFAMASAASQAAGMVALIPNAIGIAVQGFGSMMLGFSGISDAVGALSKAQSAGGRTAAQTARTQEQAQKRIAQARQAAVDAAENGNRRIAAAEKQVTDSQKASLRAQEALNQARKDAKEALEDYQLQLSGAALDEEGAALAVERAREAWNKAMRSPTSTALDRKEADLALRQAEQSLKEIQDRNEELREEADEATKRGVEGSLQVVGAKEDVVDAAQAERDAQTDLADAYKETARDIADAQDAIADAVADAAAQMATASAAASALALAMGKLSPEGREFAQFVNDELKPRLESFRNAVQARLLPSVKEALTTLMTDQDPKRGLGSYLDVLQKGMVDSAGVMGGFTKDLAKLMSTEAFKADTATIMASNNKAMGDFAGAGVAVVNILRHIAVAVGPMVEDIAKLTREWFEQKSALLETADGQDRLRSFMERSYDRLKQLWTIVENVGGALRGMGDAGVGAGDDLLDKFERLTQKWETWSKSDKGQDRMKEFFDTVAPLLEKMGETLSQLAETFTLLGEDGGGALGRLLDVVNALLTGINFLLESPIGGLVATFLSFGLVASVLMLVVKRIQRMTSGVTLLAGALGKVSRAARNVKMPGGGRASRGGGGDTATSAVQRSAGARSRAETRANRVRQEVYWTHSMPVYLTEGGLGGAGGGKQSPDIDGSGANDSRKRGGYTTADREGGGAAAKPRRSGRGRAIGAGLGGAVGAASFLLPDVTGWQATAITAVGMFADVAGAKIGEWAGKAGSKIAGWASSAASAVGGWASSVGTAASNAGSRIAGWASSGATAVSGWATSAGTAVSGWATSFGTAVSNAGTKLAGWASNAATTAANVASSAGKMIADAGRVAFAWAGAKLKVAAEWAAMAAAAALNGLKMAATWAAQVVGQAVSGAAAFAVQAARVVGGWVLMGVQSLIQAGRMAAAWLIAMGPVGIIIGIVLGLVALIIANWDTVKRVTVGVFTAIVGAIRGAFEAIPGLVKKAINAVIGLINTMTIGGINLLITGINKVNPFTDIPKVPKIPLLAEGAIIRRPTLAMVGEDGPEVVLPLSEKRSRRRAELMAQAGLSAGEGISGMGGWARLDSVSGGSLADLVATSGSAINETGAGDRVGTIIQEGAVKQYITNPAPETASGTLNSGLRRIAQTGIFGSGPS